MIYFSQSHLLFVKTNEDRTISRKALYLAEKISFYEECWRSFYMRESGFLEQSSIACSFVFYNWTFRLVVLSSFGFASSNCYWLRYITWFILSIYNCCLQKQMNIELQVKGSMGLEIKKIYYVEFICNYMYWKEYHIIGWISNEYHIIWPQLCGQKNTFGHIIAS